MKKAIAFFLVTLTLLAALAGCAQVPDGGQESRPNGEQESGEPTQLDNIPEDLKFDGQDVVILSRAKAGWTQDEVAVPELNSEPVNDAIFNRNLTVGDRLGINIVSAPIEDPSEFKPIEEIERVVKAGSADYDLVAAACYVTLPSVLKGTFYDLRELEYLDLEQEYWMQNYNEVISYGESQFTATGAIALSTYRFAFVTTFNKNLFDDKGLPYLYEAVSNNTWTLDYQSAIVKDFYQDLDGDGKKDEEDLYGLVSCPGLSTDPYWASCCLPILQKNADGDYTYVLDVGRLSDTVDKVLNLFYDCGGTYLYKEVASNVEQDEIRKLFAKGYSAMATQRLVAVEQVEMRDMVQLYGIVPMPKFDTAQKEYGTLLHDQFTLFCIPSSAEKSKLEMIGATMEVMASESARTVKPAYYEIAVKRKYMSDPIAWDMLDLVFRDVAVDAGIVYGDSLTFPHHKLRTIIQGKTNRVSSQFGRMESTVNRYLTKIISKLERLE